MPTINIRWLVFLCEKINESEKIEMVYTEEMKKQINSVGFQVIEFKRLIKRFIQAVESLAEAIRKMIEQIKNAFGSLLNFNDAMQKLSPKQRYKFCRKLGIKNYQCFFQRKQIYRARSCC